MNPKGFILTNKYYEYSGIVNQANRIKEEFLKLGYDLPIIKNGNGFYIDENSKIVSNLSSYDFCVFLDKDKYTGTALETLGIRTFNKISSIIDCDDKTLTFLRIAGSNVKIPKTIPSPLCYNSDAVIDETYLKEVAKELGYPFVFKLGYSSLGKGVFLVKDFNEFLKLSNEYKFEAKCYQEFISSSYGKDVRIICIGGKFFSAIERVSETDFRSNGYLGGKGRKVEVSKEFISVAEKVAKLLKLDYMGIDLLYGKNNEPILCEVNSNAFFTLSESVTGKNVAKAYAEYIISQVNGEKK